MPDWREFAEPEDAEMTELTVTAHQLMLRIARDQLGVADRRDQLSYRGFDSARGGAALRIRVSRAEPYVVEVRGQSSATAHGKQGAHPACIALLRELEEPVQMLFVESGLRVCRAVWLGTPEEPPIINIDNGGGEMRRQGWAAGDLPKYALRGDVEDARRYQFLERAPERATAGLF